MPTAPFKRLCVRHQPAWEGLTAMMYLRRPQRTLREAMAEAADRDRVARQYVTDFADVFERGEPLLVATLARSADRRLATLVTYLDFLAAFPDSHIVRKHGPIVAGQTREQARATGCNGAGRPVGWRMFWQPFLTGMQN